MSSDDALKKGSAKQNPLMGGVRSAGREVLAALEQHGLLLKQDKKLPSVVTLVAGEPVSGSWWSHEKSTEMFHVLEALAEHEDVAVAKLVAGKDTFVHRNLFAALAGVGMSGEPWQTDGLSEEAEALLHEIQFENEQLAKGDVARELERRLLVASAQVHTEDGKHAKALWSWHHWRGTREVYGRRVPPARAKRTIEEAVAALAGDGKLPKLPWR